MEISVCKRILWLRLCLICEKHGHKQCVKSLTTKNRST